MLCKKNLFHIFILYSYVLWHASIFTFILSALFHTTLFRINISMCLDFHVGYSVYCFVLCHMLLYLFIFFNLPGALFSIRLLLLIYYIFLFASLYSFAFSYLLQIVLFMLLWIDSFVSHLLSLCHIFFLHFSHICLYTYSFTRYSFKCCVIMQEPEICHTCSFCRKLEVHQYFHIRGKKKYIWMN